MDRRDRPTKRIKRVVVGAGDGGGGTNDRTVVAGGFHPTMDEFVVVRDSFGRETLCLKRDSKLLGVLKTVFKNDERLVTQAQQSDGGGGGMCTSRRNQEDKVLAITYTQTISYRVQSNANIDLSDLTSIVTEPFNNISKRGQYVASLQEGGKGLFDTMKFATLPTIKKEEVVVPEVVKSLNMWIIVGSVVGVLVVIFILGIGSTVSVQAGVN